MEAVTPLSPNPPLVVGVASASWNLSWTLRLASSWAPFTPACERRDLGEGFLNKPVSLSPGVLISNNECVDFLLHGGASSPTTFSERAKQTGAAVAPPSGSSQSVWEEFPSVRRFSPFLLLRCLQGVPLGQGGNLGSGLSQSTS